MSMDDRIIAFVGPIACKGKIPPGGFEAANRRTIDLLTERSVSIHELPYPSQDTLLKKLVFYPLGFILINLKLLGIRLTHHNRQCICHLTPLYKRFLYIELFSILLAKVLGYKIIYDIRAGSLTMYYEQRGALYRRTVDFLVRTSDQVCIEGFEYVTFIERITGATPYYFPNYVNNTTSSRTVKKRATAIQETVRLVYFGRVTPEKGIEVCVQTTLHLQERGINCRLSIIGPISSSYRKKLLPSLPGGISLEGSMPPDRLFATIEQCHFFLFPTTHRGEGHSNALTEAMAHGCVPICSDNGFNRSVVADCGTIFSKESLGSDYAGAIQSIVKAGNWQDYSTKSINRVKKLYLAESIIPGLIQLYKRL